MKKLQKLATCAAITIAAASSSVAPASGDTAAHAQPISVHAISPAAAVNMTQESTYTPIEPCRIVDTRKAGGPLASRETRSLLAQGEGGFGDQGGRQGGCGIPFAATAIQATITAVGATGNGFLKAYPFESHRPTATFMNYTHAFNVSGSGSVQICRSTPDDLTVCPRNFTVSVFGSRTDVVVDVQGYYIPPMWVHQGGDLNAEVSRVAGLVDDSQGQFTTIFDRDVSQCGYSVAADGSTSTVRAVRPDGIEPNNVTLETWNKTTAIDSGFSLVVTC